LIRSIKADRSFVNRKGKSITKVSFSMSSNFYTFIDEGMLLSKAFCLVGYSELLPQVSLDYRKLKL
jgi:hypothetical protein